MNISSGRILTKKPRSSQDFKANKKLYIVGIPLYYSYENSSVIVEFKNLLLRAKSDHWPIYAGADPPYFRNLTPDGFKIIEEIGNPLFIICPFTKTLKERYITIANILYKLTKTSSCPIISLHPGNPLIGDTPAQLLIQKFRNQKNNLEILSAKSGIDIVGDFAEKATGKKYLKRQYISTDELFKKTFTIKGELLLIYCISSVYYYGNKNIFGNVLMQLLKRGLGNKKAFIKSPNMKGDSLTVLELLENLSKYNPEDHYTLAVMNI